MLALKAASLFARFFTIFIKLPSPLWAIIGRSLIKGIKLKINFLHSPGGMLVVSVSVAGLVTLAAMTQPALAPEAKHSLLQYVTGKYLLPSNCRVHFEWEEPQLVGETMTFTVKVSKTIAPPESVGEYLYLDVAICTRAKYA